MTSLLRHILFGSTALALLAAPVLAQTVKASEKSAADNATAIYAGAEVKGAPHPDGAKAWLDFIHSPEALQIFARYGFEPYVAR